MSITSDYKYLKYTTHTASVNHPSCDYNLDSSFSSLDSTPYIPPSRTRSAVAIIKSPQVKSFISEPIRKKSSLPLTEEALARHNSIIPPFQQYEYMEHKETEEEEEPILEQSLLDRVDEKCKNLQQEFDEKIKQLEAQFTKAEQDFNQSRVDIQELSCMEKEYLNQGIQTELGLQDLKKVELEANEWKLKAQGLQEFVEETKKIIWDSPFIPMNSICRTLPTNEDANDDICDYHRTRIEKYNLKSQQEKQLYSNDNNATLKKISNWSKSIQHY